MILLAVPLIDTIKVFVLRILKKRDPFSGDTSHQHYIIKNSVVSHEATVFIIEIFSFIFIALIYLKDFRWEATVLFFILAFILLSIQPILLKFNVAEVINSLLLNARDIPIKNLMKIIKIQLIFGGFLMI